LLYNDEEDDNNENIEDILQITEPQRSVTPTDNDDMFLVPTHTLLALSGEELMDQAIPYKVSLKSYQQIEK